MRKIILLLFITFFAVGIYAKSSQTFKARPQQGVNFHPGAAFWHLRTNNHAGFEEQMKLLRSIVSNYLSSPENQELLRNVSRQVKSIASLLDITVIRISVNTLIDELFNSLTSIQEQLIKGLSDVQSSSDPIPIFKRLIGEIQKSAQTHYSSLNRTLQARISQIISVHAARLSEANGETIATIQELLGNTIKNAQEVRKN